jgi:protein-S-isoprenylcysteine O-methyltransferase Ste14
VAVARLNLVLLGLDRHLMQALELRIPPPIVALIVAAIMWGISVVTPSIEMPSLIRITTAIAIALTGVATAISGVIAFRHAKTTVNPLKPETTSAIVTSGVYRFTRNPMYVGLASVLLAWAVFVSSVWALLGPLVFVLYMNRFQIMPEERVLSRTFGNAYVAYQARVRRWL